MSQPFIPIWLKLAYTVWMAIWIPVYWIHNGPENFLWLCDIANFLVGAALWLESPLLFSSQAVAVLVVQFAWALDFATRLILGFHLIGGTEYMFDTTTPLWLRGMSLFHLVVPVLLLWGVWRLGFHRRGWLLQSAITCVILPLSLVAGTPEDNLNWLWKPFGVPQTWMPPMAFLLVCMIAYPLLLFYPTHLALSRWIRLRGRRLHPG